MEEAVLDPGQDVNPLDANVDDRALLMRLLAQSNQTMAALARRSQQTPDLDLLGGAAGSNDNIALGGARGTAAMEVLRQDFMTRPANTAALTRSMMARSMGTDPTSPQDAIAYFQRNGRFTRDNREGVQLAMILGSIWNHLGLGETQHAHALTGVGLAALDQWGISNSLDMGYLWTHLPDPAWSLMQRSGPQRGLRPYSQLASPRWVAATVAYLRDLDAMEERMHGQARPRGPKGRGRGEDSAPDAEDANGPGRNRRRGGRGGRTD